MSKSIRILAMVLAVMMVSVMAPAEKTAADDAAKAAEKAQQAKEKAATQAQKASEKKTKIDEVASETLDELFAASGDSKQLYNDAYGYAVFDNLKLSLIISGGAGSGVAVNKKSRERTYMRMGTAGLGIGLGGQKYQVVFLFEDEATYSKFIDKGWEADVQANAVAGPVGRNAETAFSGGLAFYQLTEAGLMLQADISGSKYWKSKKLNMASAH